MREATADDMKRDDWEGDGLKSQSFILTPDVENDVTGRRNLRAKIHLLSLLILQNTDLTMDLT